MRRHDQNIFILFVLLCGLPLLLSCSTTRHAATVTTVETRDTTQTHLLDTATTAAEAQSAELRDTIEQKNHVTGSLKIERDTAGRPVLYIWDTSALMRAAILQEYKFDGMSMGFGSYRATNSTATKAEDVEKEEETATKVGPALEDYIGAGLMAFIILYFLFICAEHLWRNRSK
ncbi:MULTISPECIES: hypothetical protein [Muribaculaceae]|nr:MULTISPECIES: hypothetical protein [Muribaculaceae]